METTIKINTDLLNMDIVEGIKKMFPNKNVEITIQDEYDNLTENGDSYMAGDDDATQFILNRPAYAGELLRRIKEYESSKETAKVKPEEVV